MSEYLFLQEYDAEHLSAVEQLVERSIERLPYTLAVPVANAFAAIASGRYQRAMNLVLDFFEISVQYSSVVMLRLLHKLSTPSSMQLAASIVKKIDTKRPLSFGDWVNDFFSPMMALLEKEMPGHPLVAAMCGNIYTRRINRLMGGKNEASIVKIRNDYRGHGNTLSEELYKSVLYSLEPRLVMMLRSLEPFTYGTAVAVDADGNAWCMNGTTPQRVENSCSLLPGHYYLCGDGETTDLFPLVFMDGERFVYVFSTLKDESAGFLSSNENAMRFESDVMNDDIDGYLKRFVPSFDVAKELNWDEFLACMQQETSAYLDKVYKEKKYNRELFVERDNLTSMLYGFWESNATLFPLIGEAGQGKTNQLCYWTEKLNEGREAVLIFNSSDFSGETLDNAFRRIFGIKSKKGIKRHIDALHSKAQERGARVCFFFDALNECMKYYGKTSSGPLMLYDDILSLLVSEEYPCFKVVFTCRLYTWKNMILPEVATGNALIYTPENDSEVSVAGFTKEETRKAYSIYQELYRMHTPYEQLDARILLRLRDPLVMKFTSSNFLGKELSADMSDYTSVNLFDRMLSDIGNSYAGGMQCEILEALAEYLVGRYLDGEAADSIPVEQIKVAKDDSSDPLHTLSTRMYNSNGITIAYAELLNKAERPMLRETEKGIGAEKVLYVQFVYERFLEFMMGRALVRRMRADIDDVGRPVPAERYVSFLEAAEQDVLFMSAMRNALLIDTLATNNYGGIVELESCWGEHYSVMSLLTDTVNTLIRENYEEQLFALMYELLDVQPEQGVERIAEFNDVIRRIETSNADETVIARHKELNALLAPVKRLRKLASVSIVNGMLLTEYFNEGLYLHDAKELLWKLMCDPILEVRNDACVYVYYLSNKRYTLEHNLLQGNLALKIVKEMYAIIKSHSLLGNVVRRSCRDRLMVFLETATRLSVLLIIDKLLTQSKDSDVVVGELFDEMRSIFRYFTCDFRLIRLFMPFFQLVMRKQVTFQSSYVNNVMEYQTFWERASFGNDLLWKREGVTVAMTFLKHYQRFVLCNEDGCEGEEERFRDFYPHILSAYTTGDSFSYFILERILVIMGVSRWENIAPVVEEFFGERYRNNEWFDYSQMSMLYVLLQVGVNSTVGNGRLLEIFTRECEDWTCRNRGYFRGRRSASANPLGLYKRNVMSWYAHVYCVHSGDNVPHSGDERAVPLFYALIDKAIADNDKELLYHLVENISELITDFSYIETGLHLVKHILVRFDTQEKVDRLDAVKLAREGIYGYTLVRLVGNLFSTAKNYFPAKVDAFIQKDIVGLTFPGIPTYRDEILNYHPSGETLSDLLTHKFGKFLIWALLNKEVVDTFAIEAVDASIDAGDSFAWFEKVVRILVKHMFDVKL